MRVYKVFKDIKGEVHKYFIEEILESLDINMKKEFMGDNQVLYNENFKLIYYNDIKRIGLKQVIISKNLMMYIYANLIDNGYILDDIFIFKNNSLGNENEEYLRVRYKKVFEDLENLKKCDSVINILKFHESIFYYDEMEISSMKFSKNNSSLKIGINGMIVFDKFDDEGIEDICKIIFSSINRNSYDNITRECD